MRGPLLRPAVVDPTSSGGARLMLTRAEVMGNVIVITPNDPRIGGLRFSIPNTTRAEGFTEWNVNFHRYWTPTACPPELNGPEGLRALSQALIANATPGVDQPASAQGARNDVGRIWFGDTGHNYVRSFVAASPNPDFFTSLVVNYTIRGEHTLNEGFVIRYARRVRDGTILISYGEGSSAKQNMLLEDFWLPQVYQVWTANHREIIASAKRAVGR